MAQHELAETQAIAGRELLVGKKLHQRLNQEFNSDTNCLSINKLCHTKKLEFNSQRGKYCQADDT